MSGDDKNDSDLPSWLQFLCVALIVVALVTYVFAKIHFFTRYFKLPLGDYLAEHWPYWAVMDGCLALAFLIGKFGPRKERRG
jgi:hypothetical protein